MRRLLPALALAAATTLYAALPANAQNGGTTYGSSTSGSEMSGMGMSGMGMPGMGMPGMDMSGMGGMPMGMSGMSMMPGMGGMGMMPGMSGMGMASSSWSGGQSYTCAIGQVVPFFVPQQGLDQAGRPYVYQVQGIYGPYDGFGYPVQIMSMGLNGGVPFSRQTIGYLPSPCPAGALGGLGGSSAGTWGGWWSPWGPSPRGSW